MSEIKNWEVIRIYYGLLGDYTKTVIQSGLTEQQATEMANRLESNPGSSSVVYDALPSKE